MFALSDDIESVCLIREWVKLEEHFDIKFTRLLLTVSNEECKPSQRQIRDINTQDNFLLFEKCSSKRDTKFIADIARMVSWPKLWDLALDGGHK